MRFKSHPYYDGSDAAEWLGLRPDDWTELEPGTEKTLHDSLRADKDRLCELALVRICDAAGEAYLAERPHPEVNEFLYTPIGDHGYQVYVEYFFYQRHDQNSPDSDFWWTVINCPYALVPLVGGQRLGNIVGLGWVVA